MSDSAVKNSNHDDNADVVTNLKLDGNGPDRHGSPMQAIMNPLDKISETDENEIYQDAKGLSNLTRERSNLTLSRSRATFRAESRSESQIANNAENQKESENVSLPNERTTLSIQRKFLLTELEGNVSSSEYNSEEDDDELNEKLVTKNAPQPEPVHYENDIYNEKDWETDLEGAESSDEEFYTPKQMYKKMCDNLKVIPCRYFLAHIEKQKIIMRYHQFSIDEIRAISKPLWNNFHVEKLYLDGNWIECDGAKYLSRMIRQNDFITDLSLADNKVGESLEGTSEVCRMIGENCILKKLNLSGNGFADKDAEILVEALEKNKLLEVLNLRHNNFGDESGKVLGNYISSNENLVDLDLSWNNFRSKSAKEIALGLKENVKLKKCDLSYNGFDSDAGKFLGDVIKNNTFLEHLNLSNTRLNADCAATIANALECNETLKYLNLTNNPITTSGALAVIYAIKLNTGSILETLDMTDVPVTKEFETVLKDIQEVRPEFKCMRGPVIMTSNTKSILYEGGSKVDFEKIISGLKGK